MSSRIGIMMTAVLSVGLEGCGSEAHQPLVQQLQSGDADVRRKAARGLGQLGEAAAPALPTLVAVAEDEESSVRQAACRALGEIGVADAEAIAALLASLDDSELSVRLAAAFALLKLDPAGKAYVPVLTAAMRQGEGGTIVAVGRLGSDAAWALPTLTDLLRDRRPGIRRISAEALGRIGPDADARAALEKAAERDPDDRVRETAAKALAVVNGQ